MEQLYISIDNSVAETPERLYIQLPNLTGNYKIELGHGGFIYVEQKPYGLRKTIEPPEPPYIEITNKYILLLPRPEKDIIEIRVPPFSVDISSYVGDIVTIRDVCRSGITCYGIQIIVWQSADEQEIAEEIISYSMRSNLRIKDGLDNVKIDVVAPTEAGENRISVEFSTYNKEYSYVGINYMNDGDLVGLKAPLSYKVELTIYDKEGLEIIMRTLRALESVLSSLKLST